MTALRLGTRRSPLARTQSAHVAERLAERGIEVELVDIVTQGDASSEPLVTLGGTGVFVSALRTALLEDRIDLAVHSLKDLPTAPAPGITLAAVPPRHDPRDALIARDRLTLGELPPGATVGTGAPRRVAQLAALGLGLETVDIRGNIETRLAKVATGELDAVILARAGLVRLGLTDQITEVLDPIQMLPAAGQGALAIECREGDSELVTVLRELDCPDTRAAVTAERAVLHELAAGCTAPVGVLAEVVDDDDELQLSVRAVVASLDGVDVRRSLVGPVSDDTGVGERLAQLLQQDGADDIIAAANGHRADAATPAETIS